MKRGFTLVALFVALTTYGAEPVVCTLTTATGSSAITSSPTTGTCSWGKGATVKMKCTTDTYVDSTTVGSTAPSATSADETVDFSSNKDPILVYLDGNDQHIAVRAVSSAGTCTFMTTKRRKPL